MERSSTDFLARGWRWIRRQTLPVRVLALTTVFVLPPWLMLFVPMVVFDPPEQSVGASIWEIVGEWATLIATTLAPFFLVLGPIVLLFSLAARRRWAPGIGACVSCGYSLRGLKGIDRCPECGEAVERAPS